MRGGAQDVLDVVILFLWDWYRKAPDREHVKIVGEKLEHNLGEKMRCCFFHTKTTQGKCSIRRTMHKMGMGTEKIHPTRPGDHFPYVQSLSLKHLQDYFPLSSLHLRSHFPLCTTCMHYTLIGRTSTFPPRLATNHTVLYNWNAALTQAFQGQGEVKASDIRSWWRRFQVSSLTRRREESNAAMWMWRKQRS